MKRVKQTELTKLLIKDSLYNLIANKGYEDITISEIALKANLTRMTLYRHFKSKEEILIFGFTCIFKDFYEQYETVDKGNLYDLLKLRLDFLKDSKEAKLLISNIDVYKLYLKARSQYGTRIDHYLPADISNEQKTFIYGGIDSMTKSFFINKMQADTDLYARNMYDFIHAIILVKSA